jgi:transposase-like protein
MRYSASEKFEIIELVEQSSLSIRRTLAPIGIPRSTFYDWYRRYQEGGIEALEDGKPRPRRIWNKIPDKIRTAIVNLALEEPDLSPRGRLSPRPGLHSQSSLHLTALTLDRRKACAGGSSGFDRR